MPGKTRQGVAKAGTAREVGKGDAGRATGEKTALTMRRFA